MFCIFLVTDKNQQSWISVNQEEEKEGETRENRRRRRKIEEEEGKKKKKKKEKKRNVNKFYKNQNRWIDLDVEWWVGGVWQMNEKVLKAVVCN